MSQDISNITIDGLLSRHNSLGYRVAEIERHLHNREYWYGNGGSNDLAANLTEIQVTAGSSEAYSAGLQISDGNDIASGDATQYFDLHKILVTAVSALSKVYKLQFLYGTGEIGAATVLTETVGYFPAATGKSSPILMMSQRIACNNKIWVKTACETDAATMDFLVGLHLYEG